MIRRLLFATLTIGALLVGNQSAWLPPAIGALVVHHHSGRLPSVVGVPLVGALTPLPATVTVRGRAATAQSTTSNARYGYSVTYPSTWKLQHDPQSNLILQSPNRDVLLIVNTLIGEVSGTQLRDTLTSDLTKVLQAGSHASLAFTVDSATAPHTGLPGTVAGVDVRTHATVSGKLYQGIGMGFPVNGFTQELLGVALDAPSGTPSTTLLAAMHSVVFADVRGLLQVPTGKLSLFLPLTWKPAFNPLIGLTTYNGPHHTHLLVAVAHGATSPVDMRTLLEDDAQRFGTPLANKNTPQPFGGTYLGGAPVQTLHMLVKDQLHDTLDVVLAGASYQGYIYVFGGVADSGSLENTQLIDTVLGARLQPPSLPPDTGALATFSGGTEQGCACPYQFRYPAAWVLGSLPAKSNLAGISTVLDSRDGSLVCMVASLPGDPAALSKTFQQVANQGLHVVGREKVVPGKLGTLPAQVEIIHLLTRAGLAQNRTYVTARVGTRSYLLTWQLYHGAPSAPALQRQALAVQASFSVG